MINSTYSPVGIVMLGLSAYDAYQTLTDDCLTPLEKGGRLIGDAIIGALGGKLLQHGLKALRSVAKGALRSPKINPKDVANKTPAQIDTLAKDKGLIPKGSNPQAGRGAYIDPVTGKQRVLCHPDCANPHAHVNNSQGQRLDINGNIVPAESPPAHLPIKL